MKDENLNEEMSQTAYAKKVNALKKSFMSQFSKDAFIAFNDDFTGKSDLLDNAARSTKFDKQALKSIYSRYNKYKNDFEKATSKKNVMTNRTEYLDKAKMAISDLKKLNGDVIKAIAALKVGKASIKKGSDKAFDVKAKDKARQTKWFADQKKNGNSNRIKDDKANMKYADKQKRAAFVKKVRQKVAKINFVTGK